MNLATSFGVMKKYAKAKESYSKYLHYYPNDVKALLNLAVIWYYEDNREKVARILERVNFNFIQNKELKSKYMFLSSYVEINEGF
jgi:TolA-binding protein